MRGSLEYLPGSSVLVAFEERIVLLPDSVPAGVVDRVWDSVQDGDSIPAILKALTTGEWAVQEAAVAAKDQDGWVILFRGGVTARVGDRTISATSRYSWTEHHVDIDTRVTLARRLESGLLEPAAADRMDERWLPISGGVVLCEAVRTVVFDVGSVEVAVAADDDVEAPRTKSVGPLEGDDAGPTEPGWDRLDGDSENHKSRSAPLVVNELNHEAVVRREGPKASEASDPILGENGPLGLPPDSEAAQAGPISGPLPPVEDHEPGFLPLLPDPITDRPEPITGPTELAVAHPAPDMVPPSGYAPNGVAEDVPDVAFMVGSLVESSQDQISRQTAHPVEVDQTALIDLVPGVGRSVPGGNPVNQATPPPARVGSGPPIVWAASPDPEPINDDLHGDLDGRTILRPSRPSPAAGAASVRAIVCGQGHANPPESVACRVCRMDIGDIPVQTIARPSLGVLRLVDPVVGAPSAVDLDRGAVIGRQPQHVTGSNPSDRLVVLGVPGKDLSRNHVRVTLEGWHVLVTDLGSMNGTVITVPGCEPVRLREQDTTPISVGTLITLAEIVTYRFEVL